MSLATFIQASAHDMPQVETGSVQCVVTSPPYYGLRRYEGAQDVDWPAVEYAPMPGLSPLTVPAMRSPLGNEPTLEAYIAHLVLCLREWWRVLRDDGCCFVNLGDSYSGSGGAGGDYNDGGLRAGQPKFKAGKSNGLKPKDLMMVPARFALAAQADGWFLRSDIIGAKVAPMPESVTDRPTRSHEHIYMLTKRARYFYDAEAVREAFLMSSWTADSDKNGETRRGMAGIRSGAKGAARANGAADGTRYGETSFQNGGYTQSGRNMRDVIEWRPAPFPGSHFAVWPEAIPERLIRAATSERGACPHCGAPWARLVERETQPRPTSGPNRGGPSRARAELGMCSQTGTLAAPSISVAVTTGFAPTCTCPDADPVPCLVVDPFSGSGTTAKVAVRLGRRAVGVDISAEYLADVTAQRFGAGVQMELVGAA